MQNRNVLLREHLKTTREDLGKPKFLGLWRRKERTTLKNNFNKRALLFEYFVSKTIKIQLDRHFIRYSFVSYYKTGDDWLAYDMRVLNN